MENIFNRFEINSYDFRIDIKMLEKKYNVKLPPILVVFLETFRLESFDRKGVYHVNSEVGFYTFENSIERNLEIFVEQGEYYQHRRMLPIASSGMHSGGICVGLEGDATDKIYIDNEMYPDRFEKISDHIFEFVRGLTIDQ